MVEQRDGIVVLTTTEMRNVASSEGAMAWVIKTVDLGAFDNFGNPITAPILVSQETIPSKQASSGLGKNQKKALDILIKLYAVSCKNLEGRDGIPRVTWDAWRNAMVAEGIHRTKTYEYRSGLVSRGAVIAQGETFVPTDPE